MEVAITDVVLANVGLSSHPSDGSLNVLRDFFARSDTTLAKVSLHQCNFGSQQDAEQLLAAIHTNRTVFDLSIRFRVAKLQDAALGDYVSAILQNMPQLQRLSCHGCSLGAERSPWISVSTASESNVERIRSFFFVKLKMSVFASLRLLWLGIQPWIN